MLRNALHFKGGANGLPLAKVGLGCSYFYDSSERRQAIASRDEHSKVRA
ncbi:MAG: hypothetical protein J7J31_07340 [Helicobacteraceae bacterium]|nr:hypothetical protein [Helicobacteraceae bacterium]